MACEICKDERGGEKRCPRCGYPAINAEGARAMLEAADMQSSFGPVTAEALNRIIRKLQQAAKADPDSFVPHLRLANAYERKASDGEASLLRLAERELGEALRLAPEELEVHAARVSIAAKLGHLLVLKAQYEVRQDQMPIAKEVIKMIEALEQATSYRADGIPGTESGRWQGKVAVAAALIGFLEMAMVIYSSISEERYRLVLDVDFYIATGLFTLTAFLFLGRRGRGGKPRI